MRRAITERRKILSDPFETALVQAQDENHHIPDPEYFYAVVEIMGHRRHAGRVSEIHFAGTKLVRIEIPGPVQGSFCKTYQYSGSAIFGMHPCTEADARNEASSEWYSQSPAQHRDT